MPEKHRFQALDWELCATPAGWSGTHKDNFGDWRDYRRMMRICFEQLKVWMTDKYDGRDDPRDHLAKWTKAYEEEP